METFDDILNNSPSAEQNGQLSKDEYAAKKQSEREAVYGLSERTAMEVSSDGNKFRQYLDVQSNFGRYSPTNALLILAQNPEATRLGDFDYWKNIGGYVKSGQIGISIFEPGKEYERKDGSGTSVGYNIKKVFDISQVDARKIKETPVANHTNRQLLAALISKAPMKISGVEELPGDLGAMTNLETGDVSVRKGMEFADTFRSVAQELCHAELSNSPKTQVDIRFSAYSAAYMLCKKYGVDTKNFSFEDVPAVFDGMDAKAVKAELTQIRDVAETISGRMFRQLEAQEKTATAQEAR